MFKSIILNVYMFINMISFFSTHIGETFFVVENKLLFTQNDLKMLNLIHFNCYILK